MLAALTAAPADAAPLSVKTAPTGGVKPNGLIAATAKCAPGERVVSGGFKAPDEVYPYVSRNKKNNAWTAQLEPETDSDVAVVYAYCSPEVKVKPVEKKVTLKPGEGRRTNASASCPDGKQAVAGGYEILKPKNDKHEAVIFDSYRKGSRKWKVSGFNETDKKAKLRSVAYCLGGSPVDVATAESPEIGPGGANGTSAECIPGDDPLGGGYKTSPKPDYNNLTGPDLFFNESSLDAGLASWTAAAHNYSTFPGTIKVFAYCR